MPAYLHKGAVFTGRVVYVGDGDSLCVAVGSKPSDWVEVRVADFYAPELREPGGREAKSALTQVAVGKVAVCVADHQTFDRVAAICRIGGRSVGDLMKSKGVREGGKGKR